MLRQAGAELCLFSPLVLEPTRPGYGQVRSWWMEDGQIPAAIQYTKQIALNMVSGALSWKKVT